MNTMQKLAMARIAYKEIMEVIDKWENLNKYNTMYFSFHWDGCITVDDELFHEHQLREKE